MCSEGQRAATRDPEDRSGRAGSTRPPLILVAELDPLERAALSPSLRKAGYRVVTVIDGVNLVAYLRTARGHPEAFTRPDLIVVDLPTPR